VNGDIPKSRTNHATVALGKKLFMFGGVIKDHNGELQDLDELYVLDTTTLTWRKEESLSVPPARCGHRMVVIYDKIYLFGGGAGESWAHKFSDVHRYNPKSRKWKQLPCNGECTLSIFSTLFTVGPFMMVFAGQPTQKETVCNHLQAFDTLTCTWYTVATLNTPIERDMTSISIVGSVGYIFGGFNGRPLGDMLCLHTVKKIQRNWEKLLLTSKN